MHHIIGSLVIGAISPKEVETNLNSRKAQIPAALWTDLRDAGLIDPSFVTDRMKGTD